MTNNDILRRTRYALNINDSAMIEIFRMAGHEIDRTALTAFLKKEDEDGYVNCSNKVLVSFLDGLILHKRGMKETESSQPEKPVLPLTNNDVLKKLRIALELKEDDMTGVLRMADIAVSKSELTALFRRKGHKNYKECGDQFLRNFLKGLSIRYRKQDQGHSQ